MFFQSGSQFDAYQTYQQLGNVKINYVANLEPGGNSFLCVYGWTIDPYIEYYIIESWGSWRPPGEFDPGEYGLKGAVFVNGADYNIYKTRRYVLSDLGDRPGDCDQFWSVRSSKRTSGTISVAEHFKAWETLEMQLGAMDELTFCVEGYQSTGYADVYEMSIYTTGEDDDDYTVITTPFIKEGAGNFKWVLSEIPAYINSWCLDSLVINGVNFTNTWVSASDLPAKQNGYFYIDYEASYSWSHVELE